MRKIILYLTLSAFLVTYVSCQGSEHRCPSASTIEPCKCRQASSTSRPVIRCHGIDSIRKLEAFFQKVGKIPLETLEFTDLKSTHIPSQEVDNKQVKQLYIVNSTVTTIFERSPPQTSSLEVLSLYHVSILRGIELDKFEDLYHLRELYITDTDVRKVNEDFGDHLPKGLRILSLIDTRTRIVEGSAFAPLKNLRSLIIRKTRISQLEREILPTPFKGVLLDFSYNRIKSFPNDFFTEMADLQTLLLTGNEIAVFSKEIFGNLPTGLRTIYLTGNPVKCDCKMSWITTKSMPYLVGECKEPKPLKDKKLRELKESDFIQCE